MRIEEMRIETKEHYRVTVLEDQINELEEGLKTLRKIVQDLRMDIDLLKVKLKGDRSERIKDEHNSQSKKGMSFDEDTAPARYRHKKPCPFCGKLDLDFDVCELYANGHKRITLACRGCGANFDIICDPGANEESIEDARCRLIDAWNKRIHK